MSEFGKGLAYCLGLFLAHAERKPFKHSDGSADYELWFNGAADHLFEMETKILPPELKVRTDDFQDKCLKWRLTWDGKKSAEKEDFHWAIQEAKDLLLEIDKHFGIEAEKGQWE